MFILTAIHTSFLADIYSSWICKGTDFGGTEVMAIRGDNVLDDLGGVGVSSLYSQRWDDLLPKQHHSSPIYPK